jgi:hypothetical protein
LRLLHLLLMRLVGFYLGGDLVVCDAKLCLHTFNSNLVRFGIDLE